MNPTNFDWLNQLTSNGDSDSGNLFGTLGLETPNTTTSDGGDGQDLVQYLFDSAQFSTTSSVPQATSYSTNSTGNNSSGGSSTDGDSPRSVASSTMNLNNMAGTFDNTWLTSVNPQSSFTIIQTKATPTSSAPVSAKKSSSTPTSARRIRAKKKREPIFVTESPQNAYKRKNKKSSINSTTSPPSMPSIDENEQQQQQHDSSSPSSHYDDDTMDMNDSSEMQHLTSKERRQLRNKISARNFRVRRKEYINELEDKVDEQEDEIDKLKQDNKQLTKLNEQLVQEVMQLRMQQQQQSPPPESQPQSLQLQQYQYQQQPQTVSPPSSDTNSPPDFVESLLDFSLFNNNTYLSHSLMPDFDLSSVLNDKLANPPSTVNLEQHRELMTMYPLLAPALASIVIRHTFTLHYVSYLTNYNTVRPKNEVLDIMHPDDWVTAVSSNIAGDDDGRRLSSDTVEQHSTMPSNDVMDGEEEWMKDFEKKVIRYHYPYYAFMRLRGLSHEQIMQRCKTCMEQKLKSERQRRRKAATSCSKAQTFHGFTSVAAALLRNPSRSPMIAGVINDAKACNLTPKNGKIKASFMVTAPLRAALRIGGGKS